MRRRSVLDITSDSLVFKRRNAFRKTTKYEVRKSFEDNFLPLKVYLWIHGIGCKEASPNRQKNTYEVVIAMILSILTTGNALYIPYAFEVMHADSGKSLTQGEYTLFGIIILNAILRNVTYLRSRQLLILVQRLGKIYSNITMESLNFKWKLCLILFVNDAFAVSFIFFMYSRFKPGEIFGSLGENFRYGIIPAPFSTWFYHVSLFLLHWTLVCPVISVYFAAVCYSFRETFVRLEEKASRLGDVDVNDLFHFYNAVTELTVAFNGAYHVLLLMELAVVLGMTFQELFTLVFTTIDSSSDFVFFLIYLCIAFSRLVAVCLIASSVGDSASSCKDAICWKMIEQQNWESLQYLLALKEESVAFTILNSIVIDSSIILDAIGHMISYGILIATFQISDKSATGN